MNSFTAGVIGTAMLVLLGNGVVANVVLKQTKGNNSGWIVITTGWAMAVYVAVFCVANISGAHLNPAVTIGLAVAGKFDWANVGAYITAQMLGGFLGAFLVWLMYRKHYEATDNQGDIQATFCNSPAIYSTPDNLIGEIIGTFVLVFGVLFMASTDAGLGALSALPVALLVLGIGLSLGGPTGYAINPARDFSPRVAHALLPIKNKGGNNWGYAWIPVIGPIVGGILAGFVYTILNN